MYLIFLIFLCFGLQGNAFLISDFETVGAWGNYLLSLDAKDCV
jgi:hypothetical protein